MRKIIVFLLTLLVLPAFANGRNNRDVVLHYGGGDNCHELVYLDPPQVTYDEELNELYVYFGSSGTIDLECVDAIGPYYYIYMENTITATPAPPIIICQQVITPSQSTASTVLPIMETSPYRIDIGILKIN